MTYPTPFEAFVAGSVTTKALLRGPMSEKRVLTSVEVALNGRREMKRVELARGSRSLPFPLATEVDGSAGDSAAASCSKYLFGGMAAVMVSSRYQ